MRSICKELQLKWKRFMRWKGKYERNQTLDNQTVVKRVRYDSPLPHEKLAVQRFALEYPEYGYRRLTWEMVDKDVAYLSESTVYNILDEGDLLYRWNRPNRSSGRRPEPPIRPHQRWHTDLMYLRIGDVWFFLITFIDAYSRYVVHWDLLPSMTSEEVVAAQEAALKKYPGESPEIVSDRGSQYTSKDFKKLMREFELNHILCRVHHPQSNGVIERYHRTTREKLAVVDLKDYEQALKVIENWVKEYNEKRLHAGLGYLQPEEYFSGNPTQRFAERNFKLAMAKEDRKAYWLEQEQKQNNQAEMELAHTH
jgi:transposase InsO family protein